MAPGYRAHQARQENGLGRWNRIVISHSVPESRMPRERRLVRLGKRECETVKLDRAHPITQSHYSILQLNAQRVPCRFAVMNWSSRRLLSWRLPSTDPVVNTCSRERNV